MQKLSNILSSVDYGISPFAAHQLLKDGKI